MHSTSERIGGYELIGKIASGGMAEVFLARRTGAMGFEKFVVVKRILPHLANESEFVSMFLDEARIAAQIHHSNVVQIYDLGQADNSYYIVMEYLQGQSLSAALKFAYKRKLFPPFPIVARVVANACAGLHAAHELRDVGGEPMGLVHRDVSPQNVVILYNGDVKLVDFGVAKARGRLTRTTTHSLKGKYAYMSPEQALGKELDRRSDVFAMGIVLWECLAMKRLYQSESELAILRAITEAPTTAPSTFRPECPESVEAVAMKALAKDPDHRYATAAEMQKDLEAALRALPVGAGSSETAEYMQQLFPSEITRSREVLSAAARGDIPTATSNHDVFAELRHDGSAETGPSGVSIASGTKRAPAPVAQAAIPGSFGSEVETVASDVATSPRIGTGPIPHQSPGTGPIPAQPGQLGQLGTGPILVEGGGPGVPGTGPIGFPINPASGLSRARGEVLPSLEAELAGRSASRFVTMAAVAVLLVVGAIAGWFVSTRSGDLDDHDGSKVAASGDDDDGDEGAATGGGDEDGAGHDGDGTDGTATAAPTGDAAGDGAVSADGGTGEDGADGADPGAADTAGMDEPPDKGPLIGYLNLETSPWTNVYLGRKKLGTTPLVRAKIIVGTHKLKLVNEKAGISVTKKVTIKRGKITRVRWRL